MKKSIRPEFLRISIQLGLIFGCLLITSQVFAVDQVDLKALNRIVTHGQNAVSSAGTAEVLGTSFDIRSVTIRANSGNTGNIYIGGVNVDSSNGYILDSGESIVADVDNIDDVYIDSDTSSEGVSYVAIG